MLGNPWAAVNCFVEADEAMSSQTIVNANIAFQQYQLTVTRLGERSTEATTDGLGHQQSGIVNMGAGLPDGWTLLRTECRQNRCHRSNTGPGSVLADLLGAESSNAPCSGAQTGNTWDVDLGNNNAQVPNASDKPSVPPVDVQGVRDANFSPLLEVSGKEQAWMNESAKAANSKIEQAAVKNNVICYDPNDVYDGHRLGEQDSYINGLNLTDPRNTNMNITAMASYHPTEDGNAAEAHDAYEKLGDR